jgi:lipopolysaccharide transport protein LptA
MVNPNAAWPLPTLVRLPAAAASLVALTLIGMGCPSAHAVPYKGFLDKNTAHSGEAHGQASSADEGAGIKVAAQDPKATPAAAQSTPLPPPAPKTQAPPLTLPEGTRKRAALKCDRLKLKPDGVALCTGHVRMWREDVEVSCDTATATFDDKEQLKTLVCTGRVKIVTPDKVAHSGKAIYDEEKQMLTLTDKARLRQRGIHLEGERLLVNLATNEVEVEGDVKGLFDARENEGDSKSTKSKKP